MKDNFKNCYALYGLFMNNNNKKTEREGKECTYDYFWRLSNILIKIGLQVLKILLISFRVVIM